MMHLLERVGSLVLALLLCQDRGAVAAWLSRRGYRWIMLACAFLVWQARPLFRNLCPEPQQARDFFQEWASARNYLAGLPVYESHEVTLPLYLGVQRNPNDVYFIEVNAHPPTSVLLALPFAGLQYYEAHLAWNVLSLGALALSGWLIIRGLGIPVSPRLLLPGVLVLMSDPLHQQVVQGQWNCLLLLLIVGVWRADRANRPLWVGALLGLALATKLLPGVLLLYFLARRQWKVVLASAACFALIIAGTTSILGLETFRSYVTQVLPQISEWRSLHYNNSIPGLWNKLFDPGIKGYPIIPLVQWHALARVGALASCLALASCMVWVAAKTRFSIHDHQAFGVAVTTMLLLSPVAWEHYSVVLLLPIALVAVRWPLSGKARIALNVIVVTLALQPVSLWSIFGLKHWTTEPTTPWATITALSMQLYAILGLFALGVSATREPAALRIDDPAQEPVVEPEHELTPASAAA